MGELSQGDMPDFRLESPMHASSLNTFAKGPALLAKAGVYLSDAVWLYRQGGASQGNSRYQGISQKVRAFVSGPSCNGAVASS